MKLFRSGEVDICALVHELFEDRWQRETARANAALEACGLKPFVEEHEVRAAHEEAKAEHLRLMWTAGMTDRWAAPGQGIQEDWPKGPIGGIQFLPAPPTSCVGSGPQYRMRTVATSALISLRPAPTEVVPIMQ